jgi:hypothetical protein
MFCFDVYRLQNNYLPALRCVICKVWAAGTVPGMVQGLDKADHQLWLLPAAVHALSNGSQVVALLCTFTEHQLAMYPAKLLKNHTIALA